jgi:general secretion pathway protein J
MPLRVEVGNSMPGTVVRPSPPADSRGFTLLELVVAMALFAVLSTLAYTGLDSVLRARERSTEQLDRLAEVRIALLLFGRDVEQAMPRPIRDQYGDVQPAFSGGSGLELTRGGWRNPLGRPRGHLQRVAYRLEEDALVRLSWPVLDRAQDSEPRRTPLLQGVRELSLRYLSADGAWSADWPQNEDRSVAERELPRAVELGLDLEDWGRIVRLYRVSTWLPPEPGTADGGSGSGGDDNDDGERGKDSEDDGTDAQGR